MRNSPLLFIMLTVLFGLSSCFQTSIDLTPQGKSVQFLKNPEDYPQCLLLEDLKTMALVGSGNSYQNALNKIRNQVGELNGTHLNIEMSEADQLSTNIWGEAYRCPLTESGQIKGVEKEKKTWLVVDPQK
ncbi:hypothetical protein WDW89_10495 [Deltaproteobacteria bacterium TL4]